MTPMELLLANLPTAKKSGYGWSACCPAHDDRRASLSISASEDGTVLLKCHAGCNTSAILTATGLKMADLFPAQVSRSHKPQRKPKERERIFATHTDAIAELERQHGKLSGSWTYFNHRSEAVGMVLRWDKPNGKDIRPVSKEGDGWRIGAMPTPRPLYNLTELEKAKRVLVCEGEKAAEAACALGFAATTSAGGSQAASKADWQPLAGKEVWILPDNDTSGRKYSDTVCSILTTLTPPPVIKVLELPRLLEGGDVVDWILAHGDAAEPDGMRAEIQAMAQAVEPWRPDQPDDLSFRPFPVDALPEPIRGFVIAGAKAIGCDPSYLALPLLTSIAAAIGNTRRLELRHGWLVPAILWCAIVGESGSAKTPAFKLVMRPFRERQRKALQRHAEAIKQYEAALARWDRDLMAWKRDKRGTSDPPEKPGLPEAERLIVSDTTVEALAPILLANPRGLLLARDELAGWFGSFDRYAGKGKGGADSSHWLSMFNSESMVVDRKTGLPRTILVPEAAVCVTGGIQPAILQRALGTEHRESGLAARLLLTCPPRKPKRWTDADIDPNAEAELARLVDRLYNLRATHDEEGNPQPILVRLTPEAEQAWIVHYNANAKEQAELTKDLAAAWSKLEEYPARLALILHFVRWAANDPTLTDADYLDVRSMSAGIRLVQWFKHETRRIYAMLDESDSERDNRRLIEWIGQKGGSVTAREVQQGCRWLKESGTAEAALNNLIKAGYGRWQNVPTTARGGRPAQVFKLSTPSTVYETEELPAIKRVS